MEPQPSLQSGWILSNLVPTSDARRTRSQTKTNLESLAKLKLPSLSNQYLGCVDDIQSARAWTGIRERQRDRRAAVLSAREHRIRLETRLGDTFRYSGTRWKEILQSMYDPKRSSRKEMEYGLKGIEDSLPLSLQRLPGQRRGSDESVQSGATVASRISRISRLKRAPRRHKRMESVSHAFSEFKDNSKQSLVRLNSNMNLSGTNQDLIQSLLHNTGGEVRPAVVTPNMRREDLYEKFKRTLDSKKVGLDHEANSARFVVKALVTNQKRAVSYVAKLLEVSRANVVHLITSASKVNLKRLVGIDQVVELERNPMKYKNVYTTVMGFAKSVEKIPLREELAPIKYYEREVREYQDLFKTLGQQCRAAQGITGKHVVVEDRISRSLFLSFLRKAGWSKFPDLETLQNRIFTKVSTGKEFQSSHYIELLTLLTKERKSSQFQLAYAFYDLDDDGIVSSNDVFNLLRAHAHILFPNDLAALCRALSSSTTCLARNDTKHQKESSLLPHTESSDKSEEIPYEPFWLQVLSSRNETPASCTVEQFEANHEKKAADINKHLVNILYTQFRRHSHVKVYRDPTENLRLKFGIMLKQRAYHTFQRTRSAARMEILPVPLLTMTQVLNLKSRFVKHSKGSSKLQRRDCIALLTEFLEPSDEITYDYFYKTFDPLEQGHVEFDEFANKLAKCILGSDDDKLKHVFSLFDLNNDGEISSEELLTVMASPIGKVMKDDLEPLLDAIINAPGEQNITLERFIKAVGHPTLMNVFGAKSLRLLNSAV